MISKKLLLIPALLIGGFLVGCTDQSSNKFTYELYIDKSSFNDGDLSFSFTNVNEKQDTLFGGYDISFDLIIENSTETPQKILTQEVMFYDEVKDEKVKGFDDLELYVPANGRCTSNLSSSLRQSYKEGKYSFRFTFDSKTICYHLYNNG